MEEKEFRHRVIPLQGLMYGLALRLGFTPQDAADIVQETQLRLWRARQGIPDTEGAMKSYCLTTFRHVAADYYRWRSKVDEHEESHPPEINPPQDSSGKDIREHLEYLIERLPENQKATLRLSAFGGMDAAEISEATGYSPGNVRQLLSRARKRLREWLDSDK
ncbi:MAG: sigma-70 family RNA polymerase sigma factor [Bacteroidales bacterium]|nr:sigma-70 family RNA polymerase sigma factor [Bacteroidales bacterium]MDE7466265.1 sigma-70 family RNA polymerase sigma factor [Muribaculaceae bacterium]